MPPASSTLMRQKWALSGTCQLPGTALTGPAANLHEQGAAATPQLRPMTTVLWPTRACAWQACKACSKRCSKRCAEATRAMACNQRRARGAGNGTTAADKRKSTGCNNYFTRAPVLSDCTTASNAPPGTNTCHRARLPATSDQVPHRTIAHRQFIASYKKPLSVRASCTYVQQHASIRS